MTWVLRGMESGVPGGAGRDRDEVSQVGVMFRRGRVGSLRLDTRCTCIPRSACHLPVA